MQKGNYLYLGIAAVFITFAIIQWSNTNLLPTSIYYYVAWASFELALFELFKAAFQALKRLHTRTVRLRKQELDLCERQITVFSKIPSMVDEVKRSEERKDDLNTISIIKKNEKRIRRIEKIIDIATIIQIIFLFATFAQAMLRSIPNGVNENRIVGILSLLTIGLLFVSYFMTNKIETDIAEGELITNSIGNTANYYLDLINTIADDRKEGEQ